MNKLNDKRKINLYVFLFSLTYMVSYITRINYGAVVSELQTATGFSKSLLSMALTGSSVTYGIGQVVSGVLGDRISPKKLVSLGLIFTSFMNFLIPLCKGPYEMFVVWSINGFAQSFMWPPIVKIMSSVLSLEDYNNGITKVSWGSSIGTIIVYLISPLLIHRYSWKTVFFFSSFVGLIMIFLWNKYASDVQIIKENKKETVKGKSKNILFVPVMIFLMIAIIFLGMLRDGATTWMPSYISETYNLNNEISILVTVILPVFSILSYYVATKLYTTRLNNPMLCGGMFFMIGTVSAIGLSFFASENAIISTILFATLIGSMHGANLILICMLPRFFNKTGKVSTVSGVLNSCVYIGSAVSTYGVARLSETFGWNATISVWQIIALSGTLICLFLIKPWQKYKNTLV